MMMMMMVMVMMMLMIIIIIIFYGTPDAQAYSIRHIKRWGLSLDQMTERQNTQSFKPLSYQDCISQTVMLPYLSLLSFGTHRPVCGPWPGA